MTESSIKEKKNRFYIYTLEGEKQKIEIGNHVVQIRPWKTMKHFNEKIFGTHENIKMYISECNEYLFSFAVYNLIQGNEKKEISIKLIELLSKNANDSTIYYSESSERYKANDIPKPNKITPSLFLTEYQKFMTKGKYNPMIFRGPCVRYVSTIKDLGYISKSEFNTIINELDSKGLKE